MPDRECEQGPEYGLTVLSASQVIPEESIYYRLVEETQASESGWRQLIEQQVSQFVTKPQRRRTDEATLWRTEMSAREPRS